MDPMEILSDLMTSVKENMVESGEQTNAVMVYGAEKGADVQPFPIDQNNVAAMHYQLGAVCRIHQVEVVVTIIGVGTNTGDDGVLLSLLNFGTKEQMFMVQLYQKSNDGIEFHGDPRVTHGTSPLMGIVYEGWEYTGKTIDDMKGKMPAVLALLGVNTPEEITPEMLIAHGDEIRETMGLNAPETDNVEEQFKRMFPQKE